MALIKCPGCGQLISDRAARCPKCGMQLVSSTATPPRQNTADNPMPKPKKSNTALYVVLAALLVLAAAGAGAYLFKDKINGFFSGKTDTVVMNDSIATEEKIDERNAIVEFTPEFIAAIQKYDALGPFSEGLAAACKNGKWGYINTKGEEVIPCRYDDNQNYEGKSASPFHEGLAAVCKGDKWGYINRQGEEVIPVNLEVCLAGGFSNGRAVLDEDFTHFIVIDTAGNRIFRGIQHEPWSRHMDREEVQSERVPKYIDGKLYIWGDERGLTVYDLQGNKTGTISWNWYENTILAKNESEYYRTFIEPYFSSTSEYSGFGSTGLKDSQGEILIPAIYDRVIAIPVTGGEDATNFKVSNNAVLVVLYEHSGKPYWGCGISLCSDNMKAHYGYADLNGNDTFTPEIKERCIKSRKQGLAKIAAQEKEDEMEAQNASAPDWLQGTWSARVKGFSKIGIMKLVINGSHAKFYIDGKLEYDGEYEIYDSQIHMGSTYCDIDEVNHRVLVDKNGHYFDHSENPTSPTVTTTTPDQDKEFEIMSKLHKLGEEGKSYVDELANMRNTGHIDPSRYLYVKQQLLSIKDKQISLARQLDDSDELVREYREQKRGVEQAFDMIENGNFGF